MNIDSILEKLANFCITFYPENFCPSIDVRLSNCKYAK